MNAYDGYCYKEGSNIGDKSSGLDHVSDADAYATVSLFPIVTHTVSISQVLM